MRLAQGVTAFVGTAVLGTLLSVSVTADAAWRRFNAANCFQDSSAFRFSSSLGVYLSSGSIEYLACPVDEDSHLWVDSVAGVSITVNNANPFGGHSASACVLYDHAIGGACGTGSWTTNNGHGILSPSRSIWNQTWFGETYAGDYPYLSIAVGGPVNGAYNSVLGYHITS